MRHGGTRGRRNTKVTAQVDSKSRALQLVVDSNNWSTSDPQTGSSFLQATGLWPTRTKIPPRQHPLREALTPPSAFVQLAGIGWNSRVGRGPSAHQRRD